MRVRLLALATLASCFSSKPDEGVSIDRLESAYLASACSSLFACPGFTETGYLQALAEGPFQCSERLGPLLRNNTADLLASIRAGRIRLDGAAAQRCLARLGSGCSLNATLESACREALTGTLAEGVGCWRTEECVPTAWCDHGAMNQCPGVCRPRIAPGGECTLSKQCRVEMGRDAACLEGRCVNLGLGTAVGENQACGPTQGASATEWLQVDCLPGLACFRNLMPRPLCRRPLAEGTPCIDGDVCASGTVCATAPGRTTRSCVRLAVASREGERCGGATAAICNPLGGLSCDSVAQTCARLGDGTEGSPCEPGDLRVVCNPGLFCETSGRRCEARRNVGEMCARDGECRSNECLDGRCLERVCD